MDRQVSGRLIIKSDVQSQISEYSLSRSLVRIESRTLHTPSKYFNPSMSGRAEARRTQAE